MLTNGTEILRHINWTHEFRDEGMPVPMPNYTNPAIEAVKSLAREYVERNGTSPDNPERYRKFYGLLKTLFMIELNSKNTSAATLERIDLDHNVTLQENNPEILQYWFDLNIPKRLPAMRKKLDEYLGKYGRRKYLAPAYRELIKVDKEFARELFKKYGQNYNPRVAAKIEEALK